MLGRAHPEEGDDVSVLAPLSARLRGLVSARSNQALTVQLAQASVRQPFRFPAGAEVDLEWVEPEALMHSSAVVEAVHEEPAPTLDVALVGSPERVDRREHGRVPVALELSAWTPAQATRRLAGVTVNISPAGALLSLPELAPHAATLELRIMLPTGPVSASAGIRWRGAPGLVGVELVRIAPEQQASLVELLRSLTR